MMHSSNVACVGTLLVPSLSLALVAPSVQAQAPAGSSAGLAFSSASITPSRSGDATRGRVKVEPRGRLTGSNVTIRQLVETAYRRHAFDRLETSGGPPWIDRDRFDVVATVGKEHVFDADGSPRQTWLMLRTLLVDRLQLQVRHESREQPVYVLRRASASGRLGPALRTSAVDCGEVMARMLKGDKPTNGPQCGLAPYPRRLVARAVTMAALASYLSTLVKRPVLDRTSLEGNFDLEVEGIEIVQPGPPGPSTRPSDTIRSIRETLPEQLGLTLESTTGPVGVVVIEHVERPKQ